MEDTLPHSNTARTPHESGSVVFERISLVWISSLFLYFFVAITGNFSDSAIAVIFIATIIASGSILWRFRPSRESSWVGILIFVFVAVSTSISPPTVFSGRDQGSYANAAVRLAHSNSLEYSSPVVDSFFHIYGAGKALNFPGFFYTSDGMLTTQFPLGYIVWLATHFKIFGIAGFSIANTCTLFLSLFTLFLLLRQFTTSPFAISGTVIAALSFPFLWIAENTLSENLASALFLVGSYALVIFVQAPSAMRFLVFSLVYSFLFLTRIEGIAILALSLVIPYFFRESRSFLRDRFLKIVFPTLVFISALMAIDISKNLPFYITIGKTLFSSITPGSGQGDGGLAAEFARNAELFWTYGMALPTLLALAALIAIAKNRGYVQMIPLMLSFPCFAYFFGSHISADHPWELRRFSAFVWPTVVILSSLGTGLIFKTLSHHFGLQRSLYPILFALLVSIVIIWPATPAVIQVLITPENPNLLEETEKFSQKFSDRDLILIDRFATGDPFSMISDPLNTLFGKSAVYFFNPIDLERLDISSYDQVFLITRPEDTSRYQSISRKFSMVPVESYTFTTSVFSHETNPFRTPTRIRRTTESSIFLVQKL